MKRDVGDGFRDVICEVVVVDDTHCSKSCGFLKAAWCWCAFTTYGDVAPINTDSKRRFIRRRACIAAEAEAMARSGR